MSDEIKVSKFRLLFSLVVTLLPFIGIIYGAYFLYFSYYLRSKFNKTYDDIKYIDSNIKSQYKENYINFDTQYVALSNLLPYDLEVNNAGSNTFIKNRFGGNMFFYEALNSEEERTLYFGLVNEPQKYKSIYKGVSAYIVLFTGLDSYECQTLATYNWSSLLPNFIGLEVSSLENKQIYNGFAKLKAAFIPDAENDAMYFGSIKDNGYISQHPLGKIRAKNKCKCKKDFCTFALKLK